MSDLIPFDFRESVQRIREKSIILISEIIPLLENEIRKRVYGNVTVMIGSYDSIAIRIQNKEFTFGYEINKDYLDDNIGIVIDDCIYKYRKEILKQYIK